MADGFMGMFDNFFRNSKKSSTYKPVFLRALLDIADLDDPNGSEGMAGREWLCRVGDRLRLDLNFIAIRYAKYYWDMEESFHLRQTQDPHGARIIRIIKEQKDTWKRRFPPGISQLESGVMEPFRRKVISQAIKPEVLYHLRTDMPDLYVKVDTNIIELDYGLVGFLHEHKTIIRQGLNGVIAKYLEKLNRMTPQIANKIDAERISRKPLNPRFKEQMHKSQKSRCFYCECRLVRTHVDHVIPFNYVFSTDPYNCILACPRCNCLKYDRLPLRSTYEGVLDRNQEMKFVGRGIRKFDRRSYRQLFNACRQEYNGNKKPFIPERCI